MRLMKENIAITLFAMILVLGVEVGEGKSEFNSLDLESQVKLLNKPAIKSIQVLYSFANTSFSYNLKIYIRQLYAFGIG